MRQTIHVLDDNKEAWDEAEQVLWAAEDNGLAVRTTVEPVVVYDNHTKRQTTAYAVILITDDDVSEPGIDGVPG